MSNKPSKKRTIHSVSAELENMTGVSAATVESTSIVIIAEDGIIQEGGVVSVPAVAQTLPLQMFDTKDSCRVEALKFTTKKAFSKASADAYNVARNKGWLEDICSHMPKGSPQGHWNKKENCHAEALKYPTRGEFRKNCKNGFNSATRRGWIDEVCSHMPPAHWEDIEHCRAEAAQYDTRANFEIGNYSAYHSAKKKGWLGEICGHMPPPHQLVPTGYWTNKANCITAALQYKTRSEFKKHVNGAYRSALRNCWLDEVCAHMSPSHRKQPGFWDNKENCRVEAMKYTIRFEFQKQSGGAYEAAKRNGWMDELCAHMQIPRTPVGPPLKRGRAAREEVALTP